MKYQAAHEKLFDREQVNGIPGAIAALRRPVPPVNDYPNEAAREYAEAAVRSLRSIVHMRNSWPPFISQGLRLLVLERIFESRRVPMPLGMRDLLREVKSSAEVQATLQRAGLPPR